MNRRTFLRALTAVPLAPLFSRLELQSDSLPALIERYNRLKAELHGVLYGMLPTPIVGYHAGMPVRDFPVHLTAALRETRRQIRERGGAKKGPLLSQQI